MPTSSRRREAEIRRVQHQIGQGVAIDRREEGGQCLVKDALEPAARSDHAVLAAAEALDQREIR